MSTIISAIPYLQLGLSILLTVCVLLQYSGAGVGGAFGGGDSFSSVEHSRRGFEKLLFNGTIIIALLFVIVSILNIIY